MNATFIRLGLRGAVIAILFLASCDSEEPAGTASATEYTHAYVTAAEVGSMPPCTATVMHAYPCYLLLKTSDGKGIRIGSPEAPPDVGAFLGSLKEGQTYSLPDAFLDYQEQQTR